MQAKQNGYCALPPPLLLPQLFRLGPLQKQGIAFFRKPVGAVEERMVNIMMAAQPRQAVAALISRPRREKDSAAAIREGIKV